MGLEHALELLSGANVDGIAALVHGDGAFHFTDAEFRFLIMHESYHMLYRHLTTYRNLYDANPSKANRACDYVINIKLKDFDAETDKGFITMPKVGLLDEKYRGMNAKQVYDLLKQEHGDGEGGDGEGGEGFDDHDWDDAKDMTEEEKKQLAKEIDQAIRQGQIAHQKVAGKGAGGMDRLVEELLEPKVNWREVLREYVKTMCRAKDTSSWRRINRRYLSMGSYMPSLIGERVGRLVIAIDTSGSIGDKELAEFLGEVKGIAEEVNPSAVDLIYWDSAVASHEEYDEMTVSNIVSSTQPKGGGGTSPSCVSAYLKEKKIGCYKWHYFARFEGSLIVELWKMPGEKVLELILPALERQFKSEKKTKDPRLGVTLTNKSITTYGQKIDIQ